MIQVPLTLYFTSLENSKASVQNVQELYPMFHWLKVSSVLHITSYCILLMSKRSEEFKAKITDPTVQYIISVMTFAEFISVKLPDG